MFANKDIKLLNFTLFSTYRSDELPQGLKSFIAIIHRLLSLLYRFKRL